MAINFDLTLDGPVIAINIDSISSFLSSQLCWQTYPVQRDSENTENV